MVRNASKSQRADRRRRAGAALGCRLGASHGHHSVAYVPATPGDGHKRQHPTRPDPGVPVRLDLPSVWESLASENASRLAAMQRADKNIEDLLEELNGGFHRLRQSSIDEELLDLVSSFEVLS